jgi:hypothetical protein
MTDRIAPALIAEFLREQPGKTASLTVLQRQFGPNLPVDEFDSFIVRPKDDWIKREDRTWLYNDDANPRTAQAVAMAATRIPDEWWQPLLELCGTTKRPGAREAKTARSQVLARTYFPEDAAIVLNLALVTLESFIRAGRLSSFVDPAGRTRIPVEAIDEITSDPVKYNALFASEQVTLRELADFFNTKPATIGQRLGNGARNPSAKVHWGLALRRLWPNNDGPTLDVFRTQAAEDHAEQKGQPSPQKTAKTEKLREKRRREREERMTLRARLLAGFPTWRHERRETQQVTLHVGPPNSGKTYQALEALKAAGSGWYLAPLRLLAFEVYDRLNAAGVPCNLLTGEESFTRDGAQITAATVEMFDAQRPARCVVIDEAHMLADADRGWAWTRALMEAEAGEIHIISSETGRDLVERLAKAAAMPITIVEHERLTPIRVADRHWTLESLPNRTILVSFSRRGVLQLKTYLENLKRTVSVVYGNLPPEVRRKQADRFAEGKTQICIATDAVGMGLNLPADCVCFYEVEKFDGRELRELTAAEIHQIGGRAGRYGLSEGGVIGATDRVSLRVIQALFDTKPEPLTFARIAPEVEDLELIPGSLAERFSQWQQLGSIPDDLRELIKPADIDERIALAGMLKDEEVNQLGLAAAVRIVNAPTRESTRLYWRLCAERIIAGNAMPLPAPAPNVINNARDLEITEHSISAADIYLWLSQREEFADCAPDAETVREQRTFWSMNIDSALTRKLDTRAQCNVCGRPLPVNHRFSVCDRCFHKRQRNYW